MGIVKGASFSECQKYRYSLTRHWHSGSPDVAWVLLNPSTADMTIDDPTIRRCMDFSMRLGFGGMYLVNLFAFRATDPKIMEQSPNPVGPDNEHSIVIAGKHDKVIVAWGNHGSYLDQDKEGLELLSYGGAEINCLGITKTGQPKHPLYLRADTELQPYPDLPTNSEE